MTTSKSCKISVEWRLQPKPRNHSTTLNVTPWGNYGRVINNTHKKNPKLTIFPLGTLSIAADFAKTQPVGTLYSIDTKKQLKSHVDKIFCSNGLAFNDQTQKMFYIDSLAGSVDQFDFDLASATICKKLKHYY